MEGQRKLTVSQIGMHGLERDFLEPCTVFMDFKILKNKVELRSSPCYSVFCSHEGKAEGCLLEAHPVF